MCDEILLFNGRFRHQKSSIFDDFKQQYLVLVESAQTKFKPERLDYQAKHLWCSLLQRPSINLLICHNNNVWFQSWPSWINTTFHVLENNNVHFLIIKGLIDCVFFFFLVVLPKFMLRSGCWYDWTLACWRYVYVVMYIQMRENWTSHNSILNTSVKHF